MDVNGDGRPDIVTSLAHNYGIFWMEQTPQGTWTKHMIDDSWSQSHSLVLADVNGDGKLDLVTGKRFMAHNGRDPGEREPLGVYWYESFKTPAGAHRVGEAHHRLRIARGRRHAGDGRKRRREGLSRSDRGRQVRPVPVPASGEVMNFLRCFLVAYAFVAAAQTRPPVDFEMMTWPEVKHALEAGRATALIYNGGTEQRGPQNVNGGHTLMGHATVLAIARKVGQCDRGAGAAVLRQ